MTTATESRLDRIERLVEANAKAIAEVRAALTETQTLVHENALAIRQLTKEIQNLNTLVA